MGQVVYSLGEPMENFICPVCKNKLSLSGKSFVCENGHTFDIAKKGYVNLLISNNQNKNHGDNKLMVNARKNFLEKGYYEKLRENLIDVCKKYVSENATVLDAGCGECWYTAEICKNLRDKNPNFFAVDISKDALQSGAKRNPDLKTAVASVFDLPIADKSVDCLLSVFSPYCGEEYSRVLKSDGIFIMVIPGEEHLFELKEMIYNTPYKNQVKDFELDGFKFLEDVSVDYEISLDNNEDIMSLFMMTPYYYKTGEAEQNRARSATKLKTKLSFKILVYAKNTDG